MNLCNFERFGIWGIFECEKTNRGIFECEKQRVEFLNVKNKGGFFECEKTKGKIF
jgi:hypothetical protein